MHFFVLGICRSSESEKNSSPKESEAHASAWINDTERNNALKKAINLINSHGWNVAEIVEDYPISRDAYFSNPEGLEYYEQAQTDGEVVVLYIPEDLCDSESEKYLR